MACPSHTGSYDGHAKAIGNAPDQTIILAVGKHIAALPILREVLFSQKKGGVNGNINPVITEGGIYVSTLTNRVKLDKYSFNTINQASFQGVQTCACTPCACTPGNWQKINDTTWLYGNSIGATDLPLHLPHWVTCHPTD